MTAFFGLWDISPFEQSRFTRQAGCPMSTQETKLLHLCQEDGLGRWNWGWSSQFFIRILTTSPSKLKFFKNKTNTSIFNEVIMVTNEYYLFVTTITSKSLLHKWKKGFPFPSHRYSITGWRKNKTENNFRIHELLSFNQVRIWNIEWYRRANCRIQVF